MNIDTRPCQILCQLAFTGSNETLFLNNEGRKKKCQNIMTF